jgi:imidazolonepropionase-like amidohydrolase
MQKFAAKKPTHSRSRNVSLTSALLALSVWSSCLFLAAGGAPAQQPAAAGFLVIRNVSVIDGLTDRVQANRTVLIEGNRIKAIGAAGEVAAPAKAKVIDGRGRYLIPGLWDSHVHLGGSSGYALPVFVANGVTSVREMGGDLAQVKALRDRVTSGQLLGPRIKIAGPILESERWMNWASENARKDNDTGMLETLARRIAITGPDQAREAVRKLALDGVDLVKVRNTHSAEAFLAILSEAEKHNLPVAAHAPRMNLISASEGGLGSIEHVETVASLRGDVGVEDLARSFSRNGTLYTPTLVIQVIARLTPKDALSELLNDTDGKVHERNRYVPRSMLERWKRDFEMQKNEGSFDWAAQTRKGIAEFSTMHKAGVGTLAGTDFGAPLIYPGFSLHDELRSLVKEGGLTPFQALQAASVNAAQFFGLQEEIGTVGPGKIADLVLLTANPLEDISNTRKIDGVIFNGKHLTRSDLANALRRTRRQMRNDKDRKTSINQ